MRPWKIPNQVGNDSMDLDKRTIQVVEIVQKAGEKLVPHFGNVEPIKVKSHLESDVVTSLDIETEEFLKDAFKKVDPAISFRGEETVRDEDAELVWVVDPIDGTAHFVRGNPFCTTMVALIENGIVTTSVIHNFVTKETFVAERGNGAYRNGQKIAVSQRPLNRAYIAVEAKLETDADVEIYRKLRRIAVIVQTITCGFEYGLIAQGKLEGRICMNPYGDDYDYAPGSLLVEEAGGIATNIGKTTYDYRDHNFLMTNKLVHEVLTQDTNAPFPLV